MEFKLEITGDNTKKFLSIFQRVIEKLNSDAEFPWNSYILEPPFCFHLTEGKNHIGYTVSSQNTQNIQWGESGIHLLPHQ